MPTYYNVSAFIDWNSQLRQGKDKSVSNESISVTRVAFERVTRRIATCLSKIAPQNNFRVSMRFYHGWHKGYQPSVNRKSIMTVVAETDFLNLSTRSNIVFEPNIGYGDCLLSAMSCRLHVHQSIHLPNTLRARNSRRGLEEKMVDTAMAADMIVSAYEDPTAWVIVAAEDDDIVPPVFAVENMVSQHNSRVLLLSYRTRGNNFLKLGGLEVTQK